LRTRLHPTLAATVQRQFLHGWLVALALFALALGLLLHTRWEVAGWAAALAFGAWMLALLLHLYGQVRRVPCPDCGQVLRSHPDPADGWVASCEGCQVRWQLQIGTRLRN